MSLKVNEDIKSRITYSTVMLKLISDDIEAFILAQLDKCGLGHNVFTQDAMNSGRFCGQKVKPHLTK